MTSCEHRYLDDPNGLPCTRENCDGRGHTYRASAGPDLDNSSPATPKHHAKGDVQ